MKLLLPLLFLISCSLSPETEPITPVPGPHKVWYCDNPKCKSIHITIESDLDQVEVCYTKVFPDGSLNTESWCKIRTRHFYLCGTFKADGMVLVEVWAEGYSSYLVEGE